MGDLLRDLLESPPWVIVTFASVYTVTLILVVWKASSWYNGLSGWSKSRQIEKNWKEKVTYLEKENADLKNQLAELSPSEDEDSDKSE